MAVKTKSGIVLRNPSEKAKRFARQLKSGEVNETGKKLSNSDKAYRAGYLQARSDNAKAYNHKQRIKQQNQMNNKPPRLAQSGNDFIDEIMNRDYKERAKKSRLVKKPTRR